MLTKMIETLKKNPRTIVFTEGTDNRILDAADKLTAEGILGVILLGAEEEVKAAAKAGNYNIDKCSIIDPAGYPEMDAMVGPYLAGVSRQDLPPRRSSPHRLLPEG